MGTELIQTVRMKLIEGFRDQENVPEIQFMSYREKTACSESHTLANNTFSGETSWPSGIS
jgi:hypothetical protein